MTTILLSGFEPFAGAARNPSWDAVQSVAAAWEGAADLQTLLLPVAFERAGHLLRDAIASFVPDIVIATGLAEGRAALTPERVAVNLDDARIPDADGAQPVDRPSVPGGPAAFFSTLPVKRMVAAAQAAGAPAALSSTAGGYVCNHVFTVLQSITAGSPVRSGFVHVPATPETSPANNDGTPVVALHLIAAGLRAMVDAALDPAPDTAVPAGAIA
ncbi:pyroglutamyl-peptidase I [Curtobacterium ammoniigenes]|uniref:pyroglutamyl-peptidase I n=1 Tax=Curtobacterium ammoniigenes TaxID=395387 RepID=UPI000829A63B|nr:pyroglutamyl-peptidase I [Curtobacterium ammoniigenes]